MRVKVRLLWRNGAAEDAPTPSPRIKASPARHRTAGATAGAAQAAASGPPAQPTTESCGSVTGGCGATSDPLHTPQAAVPRPSTAAESTELAGAKQLGKKQLVAALPDLVATCQAGAEVASLQEHHHCENQWLQQAVREELMRAESDRAALAAEVAATAAAALEERESLQQQLALAQRELSQAQARADAQHATLALNEARRRRLASAAAEGLGQAQAHVAELEQELELERGRARELEAAARSARSSVAQLEQSVAELQAASAAEARAHQERAAAQAEAARAVRVHLESALRRQQAVCSYLQQQADGLVGELEQARTAVQDAQAGKREAEAALAAALEAAAAARREHGEELLRSGQQVEAARQAAQEQARRAAAAEAALEAAQHEAAQQVDARNAQMASEEVAAREREALERRLAEQSQELAAARRAATEAELRAIAEREQAEAAATVAAFASPLRSPLLTAAQTGAATPAGGRQSLPASAAAPGALSARRLKKLVVLTPSPQLIHSTPACTEIGGDRRSCRSEELGTIIGRPDCPHALCAVCWSQLHAGMVGGTLLGGMHAFGPALRDHLEMELSPGLYPEKGKKMRRDATVDEIYQLGSTLGEGAFSKVKIATERATGEQWACKARAPGIMSLPKPGEEAQDGEEGSPRARILREIDVLLSLDHPNVVYLREYFLQRSRVYLIMELLRGGELLDAVVEAGHYSEDDARTVFAQLISGVRYLHSMGVVHRDLKLENLLLVRPRDIRHIKIADFGFAKKHPRGSRQDPMKTICGSPLYMAPEVLRGTFHVPSAGCIWSGGRAHSLYGPECDLWSCGVLLYMLLGGYAPFADDSEPRVFRKIVAAAFDFDDPVWEPVSEEAKDLISKLLVLSHPWMVASAKAAAQRLLPQTSARIQAQREAIGRPPLRTRIQAALACASMPALGEPSSSGGTAAPSTATSMYALSTAAPSAADLAAFGTSGPSAADLRAFFAGGLSAADLSALASPGASAVNLRRFGTPGPSAADLGGLGRPEASGMDLHRAAPSGIDLERQIAPGRSTPGPPAPDLAAKASGEPEASTEPAAAGAPPPGAEAAAPVAGAPSPDAEAGAPAAAAAGGGWHTAGRAAPSSPRSRTRGPWLGIWDQEGRRMALHKTAALSTILLYASDAPAQSFGGENQNSRADGGRMSTAAVLHPPLRFGGRRRLVVAASGWVSGRSGPSGSSGAKPSQPVIELVNEAAQAAKGELLSTKLDAGVRRAAESAIVARRARVTVGDVAAEGGLTLLQAEQALRALAADAQATLQVSERGEILYVFPNDFREKIRSRSLLLRLEPAAATVVAALGYLGRVAFGTALVASVLTVFLALTAISSGSDDRRDNRSGGGGSYVGRPRVWFDVTDLLWRRLAVAQEAAEGRGMNFLEAIFSFVFGDGDPNEGFERQRWEAIGAYIQYRGGVVTAEELAPFLDLSPKQLAADRGRVVVDESYMLPVLARLRGEPLVDGSGNILYRFPELQETSKARRQQPPRLAALEQRQQLSGAGPGQKLGVTALGLANLVGVGALSAALAAPVNQLALLRNGMGWVMGAFPLLAAYAAAFFAVPLARWLAQQRANAGIDERNAAREAALRLLQRPDPTLRAKLLAAEATAEQRVFSEQQAVYRTDREVSAQPVDVEAQLFEERLRAREAERQQQAGRAWQPAPQRQQPQQPQQPQQERRW
eukprot:scaffold1.g5806.t1